MGQEDPLKMEMAALSSVLAWEISWTEDPGGSIPGLGRSPGEEMAIHSRTIAWKILWTEEPGRLQSMGSQRVGHD